MKTLAIGFHGGALESLKHVLPEIETWIIPIDINEFHYNITHERAKMLWDKHRDKFNAYDAIITTDTTPLCRIFLQGGYKGRLVIWICNRFDYADGTFKFDKEYYDLLYRANWMDNVRIASYSKYDRLHASRHDIFVDELIKPAFRPTMNEPEGLYYIPDYQNNYTFKIAEKVNVKVMSGRYDAEEMKDFKAMIHLPYHWQGVHEQHALSRCVPFYVPSKRLFFELLNAGKYWFQDKKDCYKYIELCNFYDKENKAVYYFDSLDEINEIEIDRTSIYNYAKELFDYSTIKWRHLLWS